MALLPLLIGLFAGILAGVFGIGGGVVIVPALVTIAKFPMHSATGTSLGALLLPVGILGAWEYYKQGLVNIPTALILALGLALGAWVGARLSLSLSSRTLERAFSIFLILIAIHLWTKAGAN